MRRILLRQPVVRFGAKRGNHFRLAPCLSVLRQAGFPKADSDQATLDAAMRPRAAIGSERTIAAMQDMIFGDAPEFEAVIDSIESLQASLNKIVE